MPKTSIAKKNEAAISTVVLSDSIALGDEGANAKKWDINGESVVISVERV